MTEAPYRPAAGAMLSVLTFVIMSGCGGGSSGGSANDAPAISSARPCAVAPSPPGTVPVAGLTGYAVDALTCSPISGARVVATSLGETQTAADGSFQFPAAVTGTRYALTISSGASVTRSTAATPDGTRRVFSLIPKSFSIGDFNAMIRPPGGLWRWTQPPILVIQRRVIDYSTRSSPDLIDSATGIAYSSYATTDTIVDEAIVLRARERLEAALPQLTSFPAFREIRVETAPNQSRSNDFAGVGTIVVHWAVNLYDPGNMGFPAGKGRTFGQRFEIQGGSAKVAFSIAPDVHQVLVHEFGHALGYGHTTADSFMVTANGPLPTQFDLQVAKIAYDRPPGNRDPDVDP